MKVLKIERPSVSCGGYILSQEEVIKPNSSLREEINLMFTEDEVGEVITITLIEMDKKVFEELDEFSGW